MDNGFVLPYVLTVIAILALAGAIAMDRLQKANQTLASLQAKAVTERMIEEAEAISLFALLGATPIQGGYNLATNSLVETDLGFLTSDGRIADERQVEASAKDIWVVTGGVRKVPTQSGLVYVSLQDISGLPSLNQPIKSQLKSVLENLGVNARDTDALIERLIDYIDYDNDKSQRGAERFDYTVKNLSPPTNSPLRSYAELSSILGWEEAIANLNLTRLKDVTTLQSGIGYRPQFSPSRFRGFGSASSQSPDNDELDLSEQDISAFTPLFGIEEIRERITNSQSSQPDNLIGNGYDPLTDGANRLSLQPSQYLRLTFWAQRGNGLWDKRVIEIELRSSHVTHPYRRVWVYDQTLEEPAFNFTDMGLSDLAYVVDPASIRP